ncbi:MAG: hypothetical protein JKX80_00530 [Candidatus Pacebacteria bacterium]|nr:hypothetical protein [Candidatus Paceibacterota bacterium]
MRMAIKDSKGSKSLINQSDYGDVLPSANMSVNPFGKNRIAEIAYKKVERLTLATHLVTNFVPKNENVREEVRTNSQQLLSLILGLRKGLHSEGPEVVDAVTAKVRYVLSLLDIVHTAGYVSDMNLEVLKSAYVDLVRFLIKSQNEIVSESLELNEEHFMSVRTQSNGHKPNGHSNVITDKIITDTKKDTNILKDNKTQKAPRPQSLRSKRRVTSRRVAILDIVTKSSPVHIKDIAMEITDCSEKTIQRELVSLVNDGVLKKEGSKRWTLYSIAT